MSFIGYEGRLYYNNGTTGSPIWLEIDCVRDVSLSKDANEVDDTCRTTDGWRSRKQGLRQWGLDFEMVYDPANAAWAEIRKAYFCGDVIEILDLDGDLSVDGKQGIRGSVFVTNMTLERPLEDVMANSVTLVGNGTPNWGTTSGGVFVPETLVCDS